ncbi:MATE family efflux transporter [Roseibacterium sp. SDUM158016]|uniref:MATE family efflux transporter n=1 Tax=Roseicyclus sediminis TaxID=2980997 RepID=UPI0021D33C35|nr:MATE family efflux transporter [Roseibacterium sp. SDUM158016]MCU4654261.1 MATE family efflux transporter [Roseibacterium sp. SDUM158016]
MSSSHSNSFLDGPLGPIYARTALPIIFVMGMNGLLAVADALFLGHFAGADALAAVTLMFPLYMLVVALATLVSSGMSSILARQLGARRMEEARATYAGAHGLAVFMGLLLIAVFLGLGERVALLAAGGSETLAGMGLTYLRITVFAAPLIFVLSVNSDALRNEGLVMFMAAMSLLVSLANIGFNYVLIGVLDMGVAGSAYGTAMAQALALTIILGFRIFGGTGLRLSALWRHSPFEGWRPILVLGAPQSLNFLGLALGSGAIIAALQWVEAPDYDATVSAYGIITRLITFAFLPLLGLAHAMQTITGNNYGAGAFRRSDASLRTAVLAAFGYCLVLQAGMTVFAAPIGAFFVSDPIVIGEVARILPVISAGFFAAGPLMMIAMHFQAIGDAGRAAVLGLSKPYLFSMPLTFALASSVGEPGIWLAAPLAEVLLVGLTALVLTRVARAQSLRWGLFTTTAEVRA